MKDFWHNFCLHIWRYAVNTIIAILFPVAFKMDVNTWQFWITYWCFILLLCIFGAISDMTEEANNDKKYVGRIK